MQYTVYPKKYAHGFCFAVLCCGYTLTDFPISIRLTSLALWQSNDCPSGSKATLMNMDKYFMWIHFERLHNHNKAKHNKTVCIFLSIYCSQGAIKNWGPPHHVEDSFIGRLIFCLPKLREHQSAFSCQNIASDETTSKQINQFKKTGTRTMWHIGEDYDRKQKQS